MRRHARLTWPYPLFLTGALLLSACPSDPAPAPDGGAAGGGGTGGTGGTGGSGGSGNARDAGSRDGATPDVGRDSPADRAGDRPGADGGGSGPSLDECFAGFTLTGEYQIATKVSNDGKVRVRVALQRAGFGTSGTYNWAARRLGVETEDGNACVTDPNDLLYSGSRHNCTDLLVASSEGRSYQVQAPDTRGTERTVATLTVSAAGTVVLGPIMLPTASCTTQVPGGPCISGGPCP